MSGQAGGDAKIYQEKDVKEAIYKGDAREMPPVRVKPTMELV